MGKPFARIDERLSISEILSNVVILSDYSSLAVRFLDRWKLWCWSPEQTIVVTENTNRKYPYKISNKDVSFAREAAAKIITHGVPPEIPDDVA
jgi:hypothetical protein